MWQNTSQIQWQKVCLSKELACFLSSAQANMVCFIFRPCCQVAQFPFWFLTTVNTFIQVLLLPFFFFILCLILEVASNILGIQVGCESMLHKTGTCQKSSDTVLTRISAWTFHLDDSAFKLWCRHSRLSRWPYYKWFPGSPVAKILLPRQGTRYLKPQLKILHATMKVKDPTCCN